mgnify:CR=1 FL=1
MSSLRWRSHPLRCGRHWISHGSVTTGSNCSHPLRCGRHWISTSTTTTVRGSFPSAPLRASLDRLSVRCRWCRVPIRSAAGVIGSRRKVMKVQLNRSHPLRCGRHWISSSFPPTERNPVPIRSAAGVIGSTQVPEKPGYLFPSAPLRASLDPDHRPDHSCGNGSHPLRCGRHWIHGSAGGYLRAVPIRSAAGVIGSCEDVVGGRDPRFPSAPLRASLDLDCPGDEFAPLAFPSAPLRASLDLTWLGNNWFKLFPSAPLRASLDLHINHDYGPRFVPIRSAAGVIGSFVRSVSLVSSSHPLRCGRHWIKSERLENRIDPCSHPLRCGRHWILFYLRRDISMKFPSAPLRASLDLEVRSMSRPIFCSHPLRCGRHWIRSLQGELS